jgi:hypothetical protein
MRDPSRPPKNLPVPIDTQVQEFLQVVKRADQGVKPPRAGLDNPPERDRITEELVAALTEVVTVLDGPEMATFFARSYAQGNTYAGPQVNLERLRALIAKASARGYQPRRTA